jgi:hypothetical protein
MTLKIEEGPEMVKAARMNERVCQVGMQQRSGGHYIQARDEYIKKGKLGKITLARTWWHGNGAHLMKSPPELATKPADLDWARYLGPVKWRDWDPQQYWNFRAYLDFGGGQITDLFTHWIDAVHMMIGEEIPHAARPCQMDRGHHQREESERRRAICPACVMASERGPWRSRSGVMAVHPLSCSTSRARSASVAWKRRTSDSRSGSGSGRYAPPRKKVRA